MGSRHAVVGYIYISVLLANATHREEDKDKEMGSGHYHCVSSRRKKATPMTAKNHRLIILVPFQMLWMAGGFRWYMYYTQMMERGGEGGGGGGDLNPR